MGSMFFSLIREECQEMSSSQKENGLLEIVVQKNCDDKELMKYIESIGTAGYDEIVDKQKKAKEVFRGRVKIMLDKYREEFNLPFLIDLRIQTKTKKLVDCNVQLHGMFFSANLMIASVLQYVPNELVEKIIRYAVYLIARKYENAFSKVTGMVVGSFGPANESLEISQSSDIPEEVRYHISLKNSEIQKIKSDYESSFEQAIDDIKKQMIMCI